MHTDLISTSNTGLRVAGVAAAAERAALNTVPQGSAADLCKLAMIDVHRRVMSELPPDSCRLLIQVRHLFRRCSKVRLTLAPTPPHPVPCQLDGKPNHWTIIGAGHADHGFAAAQASLWQPPSAALISAAQSRQAVAARHKLEGINHEARSPAAGWHYGAVFRRTQL